jgi:hypothetical protein
LDDLDLDEEPAAASAHSTPKAESTEPELEEAPTAESAGQKEGNQEDGEPSEKLVNEHGEVAEIRDGDIQLYAYPDSEERFMAWKGPLNQETQLPEGEGILIMRPIIELPEVRNSSKHFLKLNFFIVVQSCVFNQY